MSERPTKLYARPTREGLWHPVDAKGCVGHPVGINLTRWEGKVTVHVYNFGREESYELSGYPKGPRWMRYRDPNVIK